jgi:hypothetical protein
MSYVIGVEWGADRTLVAADNTLADYGASPKLFASVLEAATEISSRILNGTTAGRDMVILKFGKDETEWIDWLDRKERA